MIKKFFLFLTLMLIALWCQFSVATERKMACWVVGVSDGDTLTCLFPTKKQFKVRLQKIGLWRDPTPIAPYEWRKQQKAVKHGDNHGF